MTVDPTVEIALIGGFTALCAVVSPLLLAELTARRALKDRIATYAREDEVSRRAQVAVDKAAAIAVAIATKVNETADLAKSIHILVNSQMTATIQAELDATRREYTSLQEIQDLKKAAGKEPLDESTVILKETETKIVELQNKLEERLRAAKLVELQQAAAKSRDDLKLAVVAAAATPTTPDPTKEK